MQAIRGRVLVADDEEAAEESERGGERGGASHLPDEARAWEHGVDELASQDSEVAEYVRELEERKDAAELPEASGDAIAAEFERYLRRRDGDDDS